MLIASLVNVVIIAVGGVVFVFSYFVILPTLSGLGNCDLVFVAFWNLGGRIVQMDSHCSLSFDTLTLHLFSGNTAHQ